SMSIPRMRSRTPGTRSPARAWAVCALRQRLRATHRHGGPARSISRELRAPAPAHSEHPARVEDPAPRPGPRLSEGSPSDGAGAIDLVPLIDRNPQKFVPSIYAATAADFIKATQRVYCSPTLPSHIALPVVS